MNTAGESAPTRLHIDCFDWFATTLQALLYAPGDADIAPPPLAGVRLNSPARQAFENLHAAFQVLQAQMETPSAQDFNHVTVLFRLCLDALPQPVPAALSGTPAGWTVGLPGEHEACQEYRRELDRVTRSGQDFSVGLIRIVWNKGENPQDHLPISALIRDSIRSFDDAYALDNGEVVLFLKQTDPAGALHAITRLRDALKTGTRTGSSALKIQSCVAQPNPGDTFSALLQQMDQRLEGEPDRADHILEYFQISPLEEYARNLGG
jgi:hypothetical protein